MMRALYSGVAGLKTHQTKMDVIGNNIANVNTAGFKSTSVVFSDLLYQRTQGASGPNANIGGINAKQIGLGSKMASTNITITTGGANQTTGGAFDLKLNDGSTTNFFIVSDGTSNYFTRSGAFTIDAAGNLVMGSNGYYVMGWQVNPATGEIQKNTVSRLQINGPATQSSPPEATRNSYISGVLDKNDKDVNSDDGYAMNLNFYDSLGYSYTAKFATKAVDVEKGLYTVELANIYDSKGNDILKDYVSDYVEANLPAFMAANPTLTEEEARAQLERMGTSSLYGAETPIEEQIPISGTGFAFDAATNCLTYTKGTETYTSAPITSPTFYTSGAPTITFTGSGTLEVPVSDIYGVSPDKAKRGNAVIDADGKMVLNETRVCSTMRFDLEGENGKGNGALWYVDESGNVDAGNSGLTALTLRTSNLTEYGKTHEMGVFSDIEVDYTPALNLDNQGTSSLGITRGATDGLTGLGKALGALIGLSVDSSGRIFGTYDNGNTELLGQIPVAQFANAAGLEAVGSSLFKSTLNSGDFDGIGVDVTADGGSITTGTLEMSNVDLSTEFTDMITTQRGFQANSRIITTSDSLLEELINLKR